MPEGTGNSGLTSKTAGALTGLPEGARTVQHDPMLAYTAATALFQEVQLLNRYVQNAAQKHGYHPYLVRLQIGVMPFARNQPYDVFTTLSFFPEAGEDVRLEDKRDKLSAEMKALKAEVSKFDTAILAARSAGDSDNGSELVAKKLEKASKLKTASTELNTSMNDILAAKEKRGDLVDNRKTFVLPLLVTDNLEGTLKSRTVDSLRQLSFALSFLVQGVIGNIGVDKVRDDLKSALGTDINGLMTVGQISDNSILVRLGAARQPSSEYGMIPRTHNVSLLVMVHEGYAKGTGFNPQMKVIARSTFRDAKTGKTLEHRDSSAEVSEINKALAEFYPSLKSRGLTKD